MKKNTLFILILFALSAQLHAIGINANFKTYCGISEMMFGKQVEQNVNLWDDMDNFGQYLNIGAGITGEIIFTQQSSVDVGLIYFNRKYNYTCNDVNQYGNGNVLLNFSEIKIPVLYNYTIPLKKTTETISSITLGIGLDCSLIVGNETYKDEITLYRGHYIDPAVNVGVICQGYYSYKIGPGKITAGASVDVNLLQANYSIGDRRVSIGNAVLIAPMIGYTFIIVEDKGLSKITEKNKRIKDIDVN